MKYFCILILIAGAAAAAYSFYDGWNDSSSSIYAMGAIPNEGQSIDQIEASLVHIENFKSSYSGPWVTDKINDINAKKLHYWIELTDHKFKHPQEKKLYSQVKKYPYESFGDNMAGYQALLEIAPKNNEYLEKFEKYKTLYDTQKSYLDSVSHIPNNYLACDREYSETSRVVSSTSTDSPSLRYDMLSGKVSIEPGKVTKSKGISTMSMDKSRFYEYCAVGKEGYSLAEVCPYYMECVSSVYHKKSKLKGSVKIRDFDAVAKILRDYRIQAKMLKLSVEKPRGEHAYKKPDLWLSDVKNFKGACDSVSSTYNANVVASTIYQHVPEVPNFKVAKKLGEKAVKGFGQCNCVLQNYTGIDQVLSIGYCVGDRYVSY